MIDPEKLKVFEQAFHGGRGTCRAECPCGRIFFDAVTPGYSWEEGEFEQLEADRKATALDYTVGFVNFNGAEYPVDCDCWHEAAEKFMRFLDSHLPGIASYSKLEYERKRAIADEATVISEPEDAATVVPAWQREPLRQWAIVGMNHYHVSGEKRLFVAMCRDGRCIQSEGTDEAALWADLTRQATG